jgi:hypothetical protein
MTFAAAARPLAPFLAAAAIAYVSSASAENGSSGAGAASAQIAPQLTPLAGPPTAPLFTGSSGAALDNAPALRSPEPTNRRLLLMMLLDRVREGSGPFGRLGQ